MKNKEIKALGFRILGLLVAITAITLQFFTNAINGKGFMSNHVLAYFTLQTNIMTGLVFLILIIKTIVAYCKNKKLQVIEINHTVHLATVFYITITMTVYWLALAPMLGVGEDPLGISNTLFLHLFTPLVAIIDALLFFKHGSLKKIDSLKWLIYPTVYLISIIIIANVSSVPYYKFPMGDELIPLMYPYPFLDPQVVGIGGMIGVIIALFAIAYVFGYLYILIDDKIYKYELKKAEK